MKKRCAVLLFLLMVVSLTGCGVIGDNNTDSNNRTSARSTVRSYVVDCGNAQEIGNGSCGLTVTSISILGGGGQ